MSDPSPTGFRNLPLSQYLLRGAASHAALKCEELRRLQDAYATVTPISAGPFRLFVYSAKLAAVDRDVASVVASLNQGLEVIRFEPPQRGVGGFIIGLLDRGSVRVVLLHEHAGAPQERSVTERMARGAAPAMGESDWRLIDIRYATQAPRPFARIHAMWQDGMTVRRTLAGKALELIRELKVLQSNHQECSQRLFAGIDALTGPSAELLERLDRWNTVSALEREGLELGVAILSRIDGDFTLVPEEQEVAKQWLDDLESLNPQGITWERYPLELRSGTTFARLVIGAYTLSQDADGEVELRVSCEHPQGRKLVERVCDEVDPDGNASDARLFLPDPQLRVVEKALSLLDPRKRASAWFVNDELVPDDVCVRTLQTALTDATKLPPLNQEAPPLPTVPLGPLTPKQEQAVRAAIFGPDITLIQGPPGTGKTTVILEIIRQLFRLHGREPGFKVLLVAPTHVAVDNVLERLVVPRQGTNLVMELGVAPYRVGVTHRIAEHLRGYTPDCFNTSYWEDVERQVARAVDAAARDLRIDQEVLETLRAGANSDALSWSSALNAGVLPPSTAFHWPEKLGASWKTAVATQDGRVRAWREWRAHGTQPKERLRLLTRWLAFLRRTPDFFSELLLGNANLVCATTVGCATHRELRSVVYDYVIVDEAGKEEARRLLVPMIRGEKWVLVGDHQQLPPYVDDGLQSRIERAGLDPGLVTRSLFEELKRPLEQHGRYVFLEKQGRMHPDISAFVSKQFYGGQLTDFPGINDHTIQKPAFLPESPQLVVLDTRRLPSRHDTKRGTGYVNLLEQDLTVAIIRAFAEMPSLRPGPTTDTPSGIPTIGVIAPYRRQVDEITRQARRDPTLKLLLSEGTLHIGTVDSFQGQERDLIVFSCTRSNRDGRLGFVDNRQRLNVALSRARCCLLVLADGDCIERATGRPDLPREESATRDHLHALIHYARERRGLLEVPSDWRTRWRS